MRAYLANEPGDVNVLQLQEMPDPTPTTGQALIRIEAFGLNRSELHTRLGFSGDAVPFPRVLGIECVGEVVAAPDSDLQEGQKVAALMGGMGRAYNGSYAEMIVVPRSQVLPINTKLSWTDFGALPLTYLTAWGFVIESIGIQEGQAVLVRGATSSVGMAAINILREMNCTIIATTRSEAKKARLIEAGATYVLITPELEVADRVREIVPEGVSGSVDLVGGLRAINDSLDAVAKRGAVCLGGSLGRAWDDKGFPRLRSAAHLTMHSSEIVETTYWTPILQTIVERVEQGQYAPNVYQVFPFEQLRQAQTVMENNGASGKLVISIAD